MPKEGMQTLLPPPSQHYPRHTHIIQRPQRYGFLTELVGWDQELCSLWSRWDECALVRMWETPGCSFCPQGQSL